MAPNTMFKHAVTTAVTAVLLLSAQGSHAQTYNTLSGQEARALLNTLGMDPEVPAKTDAGNIKIRFEDGNGKSTLFLTGCDNATKCDRLQVHAGYSMSNKPTLAQVNEWNRTKMFSRAYLDEDGDPHIEADLDLDGGVTREALKQFFKTYRVTVKAFTKHIDFN